MPHYVKVSRNDFEGHYFVDRAGIMSAVDNEFDELEWDDVGTTVILEVVEMAEDEFASLPEFVGW